MWKAFPKCCKMAKSVRMMFYHGIDIRITSKIFESIRNSQSHSEETKEKISKALKGRPAHNKRKTILNKTEELTPKKQK